MMSIITKYGNNKIGAHEVIAEHQYAPQHRIYYLFYINSYKEWIKMQEWMYFDYFMQCQLKQLTVTVYEMVNNQQIWKI